MADGLRSLKYGMGDQTTSNPSWTKQDLKNIALLGGNIISPAHDIQEYQQGVQRTIKGDLWGIPQSLAGLLGIAIPGSKYIKKGTTKLINKIIPPKKTTPVHREVETLPKERIPEGKEVKVYHGTRHQYKSDIFKTPDNVLYTSRNPHEASLFAKNPGETVFPPAGGSSGVPIFPVRDPNINTYSQGARVYPLRIKKDAKIFDPSRDDHWKKLMEDNGFKQWLQNMHTDYNKFYIDTPIDMIRDPKKFRKLFRKNKYFGPVGHFVENEALQPILKRHGFHGFTVREAGEVNVGMFLDSEGGSDMLKYLHEKYKGGMIERNPYQKEMRAI